MSREVRRRGMSVIYPKTQGGLHSSPHPHVLRAFKIARFRFRIARLRTNQGSLIEGVRLRGSN